LGSSLKDALCELLDNLQIGVGVVSCQGDLVYLNASFCEILRCPPYQEHIGKNINRFIEPASWEPLREALSKGLEAPTEGEIKIAAADHDVHVIRLSFAPFPAIQSAVQILATEVTQLVRTEKELKRSEASVTTLGTRILQVQDEERRRLARDLHDTVGQEIALALMRLDGVVKKIDRPDSNAREGLVEAIEGLRRVESGIRTFSYLLHPPLLDEMGLASALRWFVEGFVKRADFQVELELPEDIPRLSLQLETALFRIAQESLSNVLRHSGSRKAWICVAVDNYHLTLSVRDEGKGFDQSRSTSALVWASRE
jgi:signal transduction histidine kinase